MRILVAAVVALAASPAFGLGEGAGIKTQVATYANFGAGGDQSCDATEFVSKTCDGQSSCEFKVSSKICGDQKSDAARSLNVTYDCGASGGLKSEEQNDGGVIKLSCK
jgi:hypothetical protein